MSFPFDLTSYVFSRDAVRALDAEAIEHYDMPGMLLMENAARGLAGHTMEFLESLAPGRPGHVLILCGGGNNGGDGLAAARFLHNRGHVTSIVLTRPRESYKGDAALNLRIAEEMGLSLFDGAEHGQTVIDAIVGVDLVMDALLGTGLSIDVREPYKTWIEWVNVCGLPVIAVDVPSGMDCDTGKALGAMVRADMTVTFVGRKLGFGLGDSSEALGVVRISDIGAPRELIEKYGHGALG